MSTAKIADDAVTADKIADSAVTPAQLLTGTGTGWAWQDYTLTATNLTGYTTGYAKYVQIGKTIHFKFRITLAGGNVPTGVVGVNSPVTMATLTANDPIVGNIRLFDSGTGDFLGFFKYATTTRLDIWAAASDATYLNQTASSVTALVPFTWTNGDVIAGAGTFEAA